MTELEKHYNKFNEDKRLTRRHGQVEYMTSMKYVHHYLEVLKEEQKKENHEITVLEVGAGTGRYCGEIAKEGYDVSAVELVKYNLGILKKNYPMVNAFQGNACKLKRFEDNSFDMTLLFGPMYHLYTTEDKVKALSEAKRVTKDNGIILVAYLMNEYSVIMYGFREGHVKECLEDGRLSADFHSVSEEKDLYDYMRLEDIAKVNELTGGLERIKIISANGAADYMRPVLNAMDEETFQLFIEYHLSTCERMELLGAGSHTVDILRVKK